MIDPVVQWSVIGLLALAVMATLVCAWRLRQLRRLVSACAHWRPVEARIASVRVEHRGRGEGLHYLALVAYDYAVGGATYRGEAVTLGPPRTFEFQRRAERFAARYAVGAPVTAWVDPGDARLAVLERRAPYRTPLVIALVALWAVTLGGIAILLFAPGVVGPGAALRL